MTLGVIEFNDQSLLIQAEDETRYSEPGFARLTDEGIETGEKAREKAWLEPLNVHNQYWRHLNQTPLAQGHRFARHHGDIAFAQLRNLWVQAGSPEELILLAPGSFNQAHLSLLLGLVEALPAKTQAILDSGLAACMDIERDTLFVDIHLHETVVVVCGLRDGAVSIIDEEVFPGVGMSQIYNSVARHISNMLIESYRFDPLHSSGTEQEIFNQIPHWLTRLGWESDVSLTLDSEKGELPCILNRDKVKLLIQERLTSIFPFLDGWPDCDVVIAHNSGVLAGLVDEFSAARVARHTAGTRRVLSRSTEILEEVDELYRIRSLKRAASDAVSAPINGTPTATHLLNDEYALPLDKPVSIRLDDDQLIISSAVDPEALLTIVSRKNELVALHGEPDEPLPENCTPGDTISVAGKELRLIRVAKD